MAEPKGCTMPAGWCVSVAPVCICNAIAERHRDGPDQREADLPDPMVNTFDPKEDGR